MRRFRSPEARALMTIVLAMDPSVRPMLRRMLAMGAHDIRPDYMYVRRHPGSSWDVSYDVVDDPGAWNARINAYVGVSLLRDRDGGWFLNGF